MLVHVGKGPWKLPRLSSLPKFRSYPDAYAVRQAQDLKRGQRDHVYYGGQKDVELGTEEENPWIV